MSLNTYPYNPFPASTDKLDEAHNAELQQEVDQLKEDTGELHEDIEKLETDKTDTAVIAPEFDAETGVYAVSDLVMYQGKLYVFTTAHETAGDWDPTEVTEKTVADELSSLESGLTNISKGYYTQNMTNNKWYKICDISASSWSIHYSLLALNGLMLKAVTFRYDANQQSYNNNLTAVRSIYGETGYIGMKFSGNTATLYVKANNTSTASVTYSVLSDGGNSTANYCTPIETEYIDSDMDYIEPTT